MTRRGGAELATCKRRFDISSATLPPGTLLTPDSRSYWGAMRSRIVLAAAVPVLSVVTACSASAPQPPAPAASSAPPSAYQRDISAMTAYCTQDTAQLSAMVVKVHQLEVSDGIRDETMTQLAGHLLTVVSAYKSRVPCADPFGAYLTLRESG
jgi:hypothetical protein